MYWHLWICALVLPFAISCCAGAGASRGYYYNYPTRRVPPTTKSLSAYQRYQNSRFNRDAAASKSDKENAKFAGASNLEQDELNSNGDAKTLLLKKKLKRLIRPYGGGYSYGYGGGFGGGYGGPCSPYGRDSKGKANSEVEQGRFLFDVNVYNVYGGGGCRGFGGGGGGLLSDEFGSPPPIVPVRPIPPLASWLSLFAPGILQNSLLPGVPLHDPTRPAPAGVATDDPQNDPAVDPNYVPPSPVRRPVPNRVYYDSMGASPITPGQLVGGVASTVNGIIQQLTGQVQPVYQTGAYRARQRSSYG